MVSFKKTRSVAALTAGVLLALAGTARSEDELKMEKGTYVCRALKQENLKEPPPPLPLPVGDRNASTAELSEYARENELTVGPCGPGEIAYPKSVTLPHSKNPPPTRVESTPTDVGQVRSNAARSADSAKSADYEVPRQNYSWNDVTWVTPSMGFFADINVPDPAVNSRFTSHSLGQIFLSGSPSQEFSVEMGWHKATGWEGPRLFTYVNKDGYATHGQPGGDCYNCNFVPLAGASIVPGQPLVPSDYPQNYVTLEFGLMLWEGDWWVWVGNQWIGYLDGGFWSDQFTYAHKHSVYGEVYDPERRTDMGNGYWGIGPEGAAMAHPRYTTYKNGQVEFHREENENNWMWGDPGLYMSGYLSEDKRSWKYGGPGIDGRGVNIP